MREAIAGAIKRPDVTVTDEDVAEMRRVDLTDRAQAIGMLRALALARGIALPSPAAAALYAALGG